MTHHLPLNFRLAIIGGLWAFLLSACSAGPAAPSPGIGTTPPAAGMTPSTSSGLAPASSGPTASVSAAAGTEVGLDRCSLLTAFEIEEATGYEVGGISADPGDGLSDCEWTLADAGGTIGLQVELDSPRAQDDHQFHCTAGFGLAPLEGVGDAACGDPIDAGGYRVYVLRGDDLVTLRMQADYLIDKSAWTALAKAVVAKLP